LAADVSGPVRAERARRLTFVVPGRLRSPTGGNIYDRFVIEALRRRGWRVAVSATASTGNVGPVVVDSLAMREGAPAGADPLIALLHQLPSEAEEQPRWREPERAVLRAASLVVTVAKHLAERVSSETDAPIVVVSPGWDRVAAERAGDDASVLCVAHAARRKGVADAIAAFDRARLDGARLRLVGDHRRDAREAERIDAFASALGADLVLDGVLGKAALARRYARARILLSASRYEGWPIAVAEAMASGVPVVAFDVAGMRELVRDGTDGILVEVGDLDGLARALHSLWRDPALRDRMGRSARERARGWPTWHDTGQRFVDVLESYVVGDVQPAGDA
jgi:glycosyltransferase involved in cell wall biosynthesis